MRLTKLLAVVAPMTAIALTLSGCASTGSQSGDKGVFRPAPPGLSAAEAYSWVPLVFALVAFAFGLGLLGYCLVKLRSRDVTPLLLWIGGFAAAFVAEPLLDVLGHLWYPPDYPVPYYSVGGVVIPVLVPPAYAAYAGMAAYLGYRLFQRGITTRGVFMLWLGFVVADASMQSFGAALKAYIYYGGEPLQVAGFPILTSVKNGSAYLLVGCLVWAVMPALKGWTKVCYLMVVPLVGYLAGAVAFGWPRYIDATTDLTTLGSWVLTGIAIALSLLFVRGVAGLVATDSNWTIEVRRRTTRAVAGEPLHRSPTTR